MRLTQIAYLLAFVAVFSSALPAPAATNVAVFNFQMTSETPEWVWLEKGLSDRIATDFTQSRVLTVTARDAMQVLAQKLNWVPEMATGDPKRMKQIHRQLRIENIVSGIYGIEDGQMTITAQIVNVKTRQELARKVVTGKADDVLELQRRLSAELISWFTKTPARQILPTLPVWTRSLPAMKALYEGMDLYDQGRYAEGWLKFRQASRKDPAYVEAQYWVGKMYYFMDRYEHARRAFERFVYMDENHPRLGDAIKEYLHTYEKTDTSIKTLLQMYLYLEQRYPAVMINVRHVREALYTWVRTKRARLLAQERRYKNAIDLHESRPMPIGLPLPSLDDDFIKALMLRHHMLTEYMFTRKDFRDYFGLTFDRRLFFSESRTEATYQGIAKTCEHGVHTQHYPFSDLIAPSGFVFKTVTFLPTIHSENKGTFSVAVGLPNNEGGVRLSGPFHSVRKHGIKFTTLPRSSWLKMASTCKSRKPLRQPDIRIVVELEKTGPHGLIEVDCSTTSGFIVDVDGRIGRRRPGLIGLVPPGKHTVTFRPDSSERHYDEWKTTVAVEAGKVTRVLGHMPWKKTSPWSSWSEGVLIPRNDKITHSYYKDYANDPPCVQADKEAIRLVWSSREDLWCSVSKDGRTFSTARRIGLPVSSGWSESKPRCIRDESGRFVLLFTSNRNPQHRLLPYVCWSRDFVHWSAPVLIADNLRGYFSLIQDDKGRFLSMCLSSYKGDYQFVASRDLYRWEVLGCIKRLSCFDPKAVLLQRDDGRYEFVCLTRTRYVGKQKRWATRPKTNVATLWRFLSNDCISWSKPQKLDELPTRWGNELLSATHQDGKTLVAVFQFGRGYRFWKEAETRSGRTIWERSPQNAGIFGDSSVTAVSHHPRWGYLISWLDTRASPRSGPYLICGETLDTLFRCKPDPATIERTAKRQFDLAYSLERVGRLDHAKRHYKVIIERFPGTKNAEAARQRLKALEEEGSSVK